MSDRSDPTRTLPPKPSLAQLREHAKELHDSYLDGNDAAVTEVERFHRNANPADFALGAQKRGHLRRKGDTAESCRKTHNLGKTMRREWHY